MWSVRSRSGRFCRSVLSIQSVCSPLMARANNYIYIYISYKTTQNCHAPSLFTSALHYYLPQLSHVMITTALIKYSFYKTYLTKYPHTLTNQIINNKKILWSPLMHKKQVAKGPPFARSHQYEGSA